MARTTCDVGNGIQLFTGIQGSLTVSLLTWETARSHEDHLEIIRNHSWKDTLQMSVAQDDSCLPRFVFDVFFVVKRVSLSRNF